MSNIYETPRLLSLFRAVLQNMMHPRNTHVKGQKNQPLKKSLMTGKYLLVLDFATNSE